MWRQCKLSIKKGLCKHTFTFSWYVFKLWRCFSVLLLWSGSTFVLSLHAADAGAVSITLNIAVSCVLLLVYPWRQQLSFEIWSSCVKGKGTNYILENSDRINFIINRKLCMFCIVHWMYRPKHCFVYRKLHLTL